MSAGSELRMLAAGLVLGRLTLRKPSAPEPVVVRITERAPAAKPKRKRDFLTNNAVVAGVVSAIVAGESRSGLPTIRARIQPGKPKVRCKPSRPRN